MTAGDQLIQTREEIVARHDADPHRTGHPMLHRDLTNRLGASARVDAAGVGDHAHAARRDRRQHALDRANEVARVTHVRVALFLLLQNAHRDFGEVVEHQVVDLPAFDLASRRLEPVSPEPLPRRDADDFS